MAWMEDVVARLEALGYPVLQVKVIPVDLGNNDIRYYWDAEQPQAAELAATLRDAIGDAVGDTPPAPDTVSLEGRYDNLPEGRMEVWIAPNGAAG